MERVIERAGVPGVVAFAAIVIVIYSLWGASVLSAERQAQASGAPGQQIARN